MARRPLATNRAEVVEPRLRVFAYRRPKPDGYSLVNTTSKAPDPLERGLSPFVLGPVIVQTPRGAFESQTFENAWQYLKVYSVFADAEGAPTEAYWGWARAGWANPAAVRFPMGRGRKPLYSLGPRGERLPYIEARKQIYAPLYAAAVEPTAAFRALRERYAAGERLGLVDFDGWDHAGQGFTLREVIESPTPKMGHSFVLAGLLQNERFWEEPVRVLLAPPLALALPAREPPEPVPAREPQIIRDDDPIWADLGV